MADEPETTAAEPEVDFTLNTQPTAQPKKKSKKGLGILLAVIAVVVAAAVALAVILPGLLPGASNAQQTLNRTMEAAGSQMTQKLDALLSSYTQGTELEALAFSGQLKLELSSTLMQILNSAAGTDMQWLSEISIDMLMVQREDLMQMDLGLNLGEQYILGLEYYNDLANMRMWLGIPELNEVFLYQDMGSAASSVQMTTPPYEQIFAILAEEKETVIQVMEKLFAAATASIVVEDSQQQTVTVGSITKEVTVVHGYSNDKTTYQSAREFVQWLSEYDAFFDLLDRVAVLLEDNSVDLSQSVRDELTKLLNMEAPEDEGVTMEHYVYLDADGGLLGYNCLQDGILQCDLLWLTDGDAFAMQIVTNDFRFTVDVVTKNGATNGTIKMETADGQVTTFQLENVRATDETITGTVTIAVPQEVIKELFGNSGFAPATKLRITMNGNDETTEFKLEVLMADMPMITITASGQILDDYEVYLPETGVDMSDTYAVNEWISAMNYDQVLANILAAGVPEELVNAMIGAMAGQ